MRYIKTVGFLPREVTSSLWPIKDDLGLKVASHANVNMECIIREVTEIELHPDNMNKEEGFSQSKSASHGSCYCKL
jgi:hypothetical protein